MKIQSEWFDQQIKKMGYASQREFVKKLKSRQGKEMDISALSRILSGEREMTFREAVKVARLLGVTLEELVVRMGL